MGRSSLRLDDAGGVGLLGVEVEVAEGTRRDEGVGALVLRLAEVRAGHREGVGLVGREDGEAAALGHAVVGDAGRADEFDGGFEAVAAVGVLVEAEDALGAQDVAAVEGAEVELGERGGDEVVEGAALQVLEQDPEQVARLGRRPL